MVWKKDFSTDFVSLSPGALTDYNMAMFGSVTAETGDVAFTTISLASMEITFKCSQFCFNS